MHKSLKRYDMSQWIDAFCDRTPKRVQEMIAAPLPPTLETIKSFPLADAKDNGVYCHVAWDADGRIIWIYVGAAFGQVPNVGMRRRINVHLRPANTEDSSSETSVALA